MKFVRHILTGLFGEKSATLPYFAIEADFLKKAVAEFPQPPQEDHSCTDDTANRWQHAATLVTQSRSLDPRDTQTFIDLGQHLYFVAGEIEKQAGQDEIRIDKTVIGHLFAFSSLLQECNRFYKIPAEQHGGNVVHIFGPRLKKENELEARFAESLDLPFEAIQPSKIIDTPVSLAFVAMFDTMKEYRANHPDMARDPMATRRSILLRGKETFETYPIRPTGLSDSNPVGYL